MASLRRGHGGPRIGPWRPTTASSKRLSSHGDRFATTHWSMVVSAGGATASPEASQALATLCENYWFPLYAFVRRGGYSPEDAQDLTQEFFVRLSPRTTWRWPIASGADFDRSCWER